MQKGDLVIAPKITRYFTTDKHLGRVMSFMFLRPGEALLVLDPDVPELKSISRPARNVESIERQTGGIDLRVVEIDTVRDPFVKFLCSHGVCWARRDLLETTPTTAV